jgi:hypothetical protein
MKRPALTDFRLWRGDCSASSSSSLRISSSESTKMVADESGRGSDVRGGWSSLNWWRAAGLARLFWDISGARCSAVSWEGGRC